MKTPFYVVRSYTIMKDGYYHVDPFQPTDTRLPERMKIAPVRRPDIASNSTGVCLERPGGGMFTGLRYTCSDTFTHGDVPSPKKNGKTRKSLAIFHQSGTHLIVYLFPGWYKDNPKELQSFVCDFIENLH